MNGSQRKVLCSWFSGIELTSPSLPAGTSSTVPPHPSIGAFYALPSHTASWNFKKHTPQDELSQHAIVLWVCFQPAACKVLPSHDGFSYVYRADPDQRECMQKPLNSAALSGAPFPSECPGQILLRWMEILLDHPVPVLGRGGWSWKSLHTLSQLQKENPWRSLEILIQPSHSGTHSNEMASVC